MKQAAASFTSLWLWVAGVLALAPYFFAWRLQDLRTHTVAFESVFFVAFGLYALATVVALKQREFSRRALVTVFVLAAAMQAFLIFTPPTLSDDMYRYVWDGRVQAHGLSPWRYAPNAAEVAHLRDDEIWPWINRKKVVTVYPPAAELTFALLWRLWPDSVRWFQTAMALAGLIAGGLLVGLLQALQLSPARIVIYLWSPLLAFEAAHGAHVDAVALPLLVGAWWARVRERDTLVGILLGLATAVKFYPIILVPALWRPNHRDGWWRLPLAFGLTLLACYAPYVARFGLQLGFLPNYFRERFNMGLAALLHPLLRAGGADPDRTILLLTLGTLAVIALWMVWRPAADGAGAVKRCVWLIGAFTLLTQNLFSWYMVWLLPLVALFLQPGRLLGLRADGWTGWWLFNGLIGLSYTFFIAWRPVPLAIWAQFVPLYLLLMLDLANRLIENRGQKSVTSINSDNFSLEKPLKRLIPTEKDALMILAGTALAGVIFYLLIFTLPFSLSKFYDQPLLDLRRITQSMPTARWWLLAGFGVQALLYWVGWRAAQRTNGRAAWAIVISGALAFSAALLWMQPFGAADLFDNIIHGRVLGVYSANPFLHPPNAFPDDPFLPYVAWKKTPSAYGPLWELLAGGVAWLAGNGIVTNIIVFKLLSALFLAGNVAMVAVILRAYAPERALAGVVLLAWNPVILYETIGNGHNDIAMIFWVLVAAWLLLKERYTLGILAILVGTLFKFIPVLMLPAAGLIALRDLPDWRRRAQFAGITAFWAILLVGLAYLPFWFGEGTLAIGRRQQLFTTSLPALFYGLLLPYWGAGVGVPISGAAAGLVFLFALIQGILAWRNRTWLSFTQAAFTILMFYLLVSCLWFQSWYAVWPLALAALLPPSHAARLGALFGFAVLTKPLLFEPMWLWIKPLPPKAWREVRIGPAVLLIPWLYAWFVVWRSKKQLTQPEFRG